ncbi:MAG: hypothetical protein ACRC56_09040, partial [Bosea sp. (in: a-proteobacteria)]
MARQKTKMDPSDASLSAVEQALNLDLAADAPAGADAPKAKVAAPEIKLPNISDTGLTLPKIDAERPVAQAAAPEIQSRPVVAPDTARVANDDRRDTATLVRAFAVRPSRKAYWMAGLASLAWVGAIAYLLFTRYGQLPGGITDALTAYGPAGWMALAFGTVAPVMFFFVLAGLYTRTQEMRLVSRAMTDAALRLAEPELVASDSIVSLSQAIRREVAAMGDGIERAVARAGELETIVRGEISTLERAYADNEIRLRSLIDELVTQRESVVGNSERVRLAITGAHENLSKDLEVASRSIADAVSVAGDRVTSSLGDKGEQITRALGQAGDRMVDEITGRGNDLVDRLQITSTDVSDKLAHA